MGDKKNMVEQTPRHGTGIEWTHLPGYKGETWNMFRGSNGNWHCTKVSPGCLHCYAEGINMRFGGPAYKVGADTIRLDLGALVKPLKWREPRCVFPCSMTDLFHEQNSDTDIAAAFGIMAMCRQHIFIIVTKRTKRAREWFGWVTPNELTVIGDHADEALTSAGFAAFSRERGRGVGTLWPLPNVWLLASAEDQTRLDGRIDDLLNCPAVVHGLSVEPLLGPVDLADYFRLPLQSGHEWGECLCAEIDASDRPCPVCVAQMGVDWVIVGGESGREARPMHPDWARSVRDQCAKAGVPFHFKQWGDYVPRLQRPDLRCPPDRWGTLNHSGEYFEQATPWNGRQGSDSIDDAEYVVLGVGKHTAGRELDGRTHDEWPKAVGVGSTPQSILKLE